MPVGFKLLNGGVPADFWLSVRPEPAPQFVPFFGDVVPQALSAGEGASGMLDRNEDAYYMVPVRHRRGPQSVIEAPTSEHARYWLCGTVTSACVVVVLPLASSTS
jgi:hypothetical protein